MKKRKMKKISIKYFIAFIILTALFFIAAGSAYANMEKNVFINLELGNNEIKSYYFSNEESVKNALKNGELVALYNELIKINNQPLNAIYFITPELKNTFEILYKDSYIAPADSQLNFNSVNYKNPFDYKEEIIGCEFNINQTYLSILKKVDEYAKNNSKLKNNIKNINLTKKFKNKNIKNNLDLSKFLFNNSSTTDINLCTIKINPIYDKLIPDITLKYLKSITSKRGSFSTDFSFSSANRSHNIKLASSKINGTILKENEEFSFNDIVGKRKIENGFKSATIISGGQFTEGIGGGVCQVSTTLYNSAVRSDLTITYRNHHSLVVSYVSKGHDAMVSSVSDFCFKNSTKNNIYIISYTKDNFLYFDIYGEENLYDITLSSNIEKILNPPLEKVYSSNYNNAEPMIISQGKNGYIVNTNKLYYDKKGNLISTVKYTRDVYNPQPKIIMVAKD